MVTSIIISRVKYLINVNICKWNIKYICKKVNINNKTSIAGSVVTSDIPLYAIARGIKSSVIRYRFSVQIIEQLLQLNYNRINFSKVFKSKLKEKITEDNIGQNVDALQQS